MDLSFIDALQNALIAGVSIIVIATSITQKLKGMLKLEGNSVLALALAVATALGSMYLFSAFPMDAFEPFGALLRVGSAFVFAFTSPAFYDLLKETSKRGVEDAIELDLDEDPG